jgi:CRP-like cAMP-binding protein
MFIQELTMKPADRRQSLRPSSLLKNRIFSLLPESELTELVPELERIKLDSGTDICMVGEAQTHVYFPTSCIISLQSDTESGKTAEIGVTGNEGYVGIGVAMGGNTTTYRASVASGGYAYRIKAAAFRQQLHKKGAFQVQIFLYTQLLLTQMGINGVCNKHHSIDQQFLKLLLSTADRLNTHRLYLTQEDLSNKLGVRRESVTQAASRFKKEGLITYSRGVIELIDRPQLEREVCECYAVMNREMRAMLNNSRPSKSANTYTIASLSA